jgi:hypothetical protein
VRSRLDDGRTPAKPCIEPRQLDAARVKLSLPVLRVPAVDGSAMPRLATSNSRSTP